MLPRNYIEAPGTRLGGKGNKSKLASFQCAICSDMLRFVTPRLENGIGVNWVNLTNREVAWSQS